MFAVAFILVLISAITSYLLPRFTYCSCGLAGILILIGWFTNANTGPAFIIAFMLGLPIFKIMHRAQKTHANQTIIKKL